MAGTNVEPTLYYVFDLDDTIIKTGDIRPSWTTAKISDLNTHQVRPVVNLLGDLVRAKREGRPVKIFLLTNNNSEEYIALVERWLASEFAENAAAGTKFFDDKMKFGDATRNGGKKRLVDVAMMAKEEASSDLASRVWFFDDIDNHDLARELPTGHYVVITPDTGNAGVPPTATLLPAAPAGTGAGAMAGGRRRVRRHLARSRRRRTGKKVGRSRRRR